MVAIATAALATRQALVALGIFVAAFAPTTSNFFAALRKAKVSCFDYSTENGGDCAIDTAEATVHALIGLGLAAGATVAGFALIARDAEGGHIDHHLVSVDGDRYPKMDVFNKDWMKQNLLEGERKHILSNYTSSANRGQFMTEAWLEDGRIKLTQYAHHNGGSQLSKRSHEAYLHWSMEDTDIPEYYSINASYEEFYNAAHLIIDNLADGNVRSTCLGFAFQPPGSPFAGASVGIEGSYESTNDAPTGCETPVHGLMDYNQIGDLHINSYSGPSKFR